MEAKQEKEVSLTLTENEVNVVLNALDQLQRTIGIVTKEGAFNTKESATILNTATRIINQVAPQLVEQNGN